MAASWKIVLFWLSSLTMSVLLLYLIFPPMDDRALEDAALGDQTKTVIGITQGDRVHCFTIIDGAECLVSAHARSLDHWVLWLGNSMLHAINQLKSDDVLSSVQLASTFRPRGIEVLTFSQPNANLQEHLILFEALSLERVPDLLLMPVVYDDTREAQIRPDIRHTLSQPSLVAPMSRSQIGRKILEMNNQNEEIKQHESQTLQGHVEAKITEIFQNLASWEDLRARARGTVSLTLYRARNTVFGITPNTVRRKIPGSYADNMAALEHILIYSAEQGTKVLLYVPPLRSDVVRPYDPLEYSNFKKQISELADKYAAYFANFEDIVPGPLWGTKASTAWGAEPEYDFMHFQGEGHDLLAKALLREIDVIINDF